MPSLPQAEEVVWVDSGLAISDGWMSPAHILEKARNQLCHSVGYVMHEDADVIILTGTYAPDIDSHLNAQVIAKDAVLRRKVLA